jgi:hypothetical protein
VVALLLLAIFLFGGDLLLPVGSGDRVKVE